MFVVFLLMDVECNSIYLTLDITLLCQQSSTIKIFGCVNGVQCVKIRYMLFYHSVSNPEKCVEITNISENWKLNAIILFCFTLWPRDVV